MIVLGIDVGTTGTKTVAVDEKGRCVGRGYLEYELQSRAGGIVEQDALDWERAVIKTVREAVKALDRSEIAAISLSTQGATMTAVDAGYHPLIPAITWMDCRAGKEAEELADAVGDENIYRKCGWGSGASYDIAKIIWIKRNSPEVFDKTACFVSTIEFINHMLTGRGAADPTNAAIRGMYNINTLDWDGDILKAAGIDRSLLPEVLPSGAYVGNLTAGAAETLGLSEDVKVFNGAHDQYCAALGCGAVADGDMLLSTGTTWVVLGVTDKPVYTDSHIAPGIHPCAGHYGAMASLTTAGSALKWYKTLTDAGSYAHIDYMASTRRENAAGLYFMPYIAGEGFPERSDEMGGCAVGMRLNHDKYDLALSLMEGVAFETKNALAEFENAGIDIRRLKMVGGAAKSELWSTLVADITGCEVTRMAENEGCALGAAMIAGVGCKMFESFEDAAGYAVEGEKAASAGEDAKAFYEIKHKKYNEIAKAIRGVVENGNS